MEKYILSSIFRLDKSIPFIFDLSRVHDSSIKRSHPKKVSSPQLTISKPARLNPAVRGPGASNEQRRRGPKHAGPPAPPRSSLTVGPPHTVTATRDRHKHSGVMPGPTVPGPSSALARALAPDDRGKRLKGISRTSRMAVTVPVTQCTIPVTDRHGVALERRRFAASLGATGLPPRQAQGRPGLQFERDFRVRFKIHDHGPSLRQPASASLSGPG